MQLIMKSLQDTGPQGLDLEIPGLDHVYIPKCIGVMPCDWPTGNLL